MAKRKYNFGIEQILEIITLYETRVPVRMIAVLFGLNDVTLWHHMKEYEKLGLMRFRSRSETVLTTLSKKRTMPKGESNNRVNKWKKEFGEEGIIDILTTFLLTDASADYNHRIVRLTSSDQTMLEIFTDILNELDLDPRITIDKRNGLGIVFSRNKKVRVVLDRVYKRTPTTKHQPQRGTQNWDIYLKEKQPTLSWVYNRPRKLIELIFRIAITADGSVFAIRPGNLKERPELNITCFHPTLLKEWENISKILDLDMRISFKRIRTRSVNTAIKFLKMGGFIEGVKICSKNTKRYQGIEKQERLKDLLKPYIK